MTTAASLLRGHPPEQAAKSIVARVSLTKKISRYALVVVPGHRNVAFDRVRLLLGGTRAGFAVAEAAERLAGSVSGTIIPFTFDPALTLIVDPGVLEHEEMFFNAARMDRSIGLRTRDYVSVSHPFVAPVACDPSPKESS